MKGSAINIESDSKEIITLLMPAVTDTTKLEEVKVNARKYFEDKYDSVLYSGAHFYVFRPIEKVLDSAINYREWAKKQNDFQARVAARVYDAQMSEPEKGLGFGVITNDFISAATYVVLNGLEEQKQLVKKTVNAEKTLIDNLSKMISNSTMVEGDVLDLFAAVNMSLKNISFLCDVKSFIESNSEVYENKARYDIGLEINGYNLYDFISGTVSGSKFIGYRKGIDDKEIISILEAKEYIKVLDAPRGQTSFVTTTKYEREALAAVYYEEHPEEKEKADCAKENEAKADLEKAEQLFQSGDYYGAATLYAKLDSIDGAIEKSIRIWQDELFIDKLISVSWREACAIDTNCNLKYVVKMGSNPLETEAQYATVKSWNEVAHAEIGSWLVALCADGTVKTFAEHIYKANNLSENHCVLGTGSTWKNVSKIAYGGSHLVGIHANGRVSAAGTNENGECNILNWTGIDKVVCAHGLTVGLNKDGRVRVAGLSELVSKCNSWSNISDIVATKSTIVGLKNNGEVVAVGISDGKSDYVSEVQSWNNIVKVQAQNDYIIGYKADGTLVYAGRDNAELKSYLEAQSKVVQFIHDIALIILHADGTVTTRYSQYDVSNWKNIVYVTGNAKYICGVCADGSVVVEGQIDGGFDIEELTKWKLFTSINSYKRLKNEKLKIVSVKRKETLLKQADELKNELASLKGLFIGKRKKELENEIQALESQLADMSNSGTTSVDEWAGCDSIENYIRRHFERKDRAKAIRFYCEKTGVSLHDAWDLFDHMGM